MSYYDYCALEKAALEKETPENISALAEWFECFGDDFWNGECWTINNEKSLYPVYQHDEKSDQFELIRYEIR